MFLLLLISFLSFAEPQTETVSTSSSKSVLQRIAEQCRADNNCPDYIINKQEQARKIKSSETPTKSKPILQRIAEQCKEDNNCPDYIINDSALPSKSIKTDQPTNLKAINTKRFTKKNKTSLSLLVTKKKPSIKFNQEGLITEFSVKEATGNLTNNFPISAVFPLAYGQYQTTDGFYVLDSHNTIIPTQVEILNRWWGKDNSIRHILVHFNTSIEAFNHQIPKSGITAYALYHGKVSQPVKNAVKVKSTQDSIRLSNNILNITINKKPLTITTPAGQLKSIFKKEDGNTDYSFSHKNIKFEIEENGPIRSTIKISSLTNYVTPTDIQHGWALRLYMYANSDNVKVDFQLQNSAINTAISAPLYFKSHVLRIDNAKVSANQTARTDGVPSSNIETLPLGVIHTDNVNVMLRNFWQTFPNGLSANTNGNIDIEMWPEWSNQFQGNSFVEPDIYWLDDMKQTYKEALLDFSEQTDTEDIQHLAKTFQYPPVAVIPQEYYAKTSVTNSYGGAFPTTAVPVIENRIPSYPVDYYNPDSFGGYKFGMDNFGLDTARKWSTGMAGGWPYARQHFLISGNPIDYYNAQDFAQAELNIRPQWLSGYKDELHYDLLTPSTNPYAGNTWRRFKGHSFATITRNYLDNTSRSAHPRDDQHAWFYHVEHAYLMSGNKWIKDWYEFMAEFKKIYLSERDPYPDRSHRAEGEALAIALSAYKYTGNKTLKPLIENYVVDVHNKYIKPPHFIRPDPSNKGKIAAFQLGYLLRSFIDIYDEFPENPAMLETIRNYVKWNYKYGQFSYYKSTSNSVVSTKTSATALSLVDSVIWFALRTKEKKYAEQAVNYVEIGLNGVKPYGNWSSWIGQFEASMYRYYKQQKQI